MNRAARLLNRSGYEEAVQCLCKGEQTAGSNSIGHGLAVAVTLWSQRDDQTSDVIADEIETLDLLRYVAASRNSD